MQKIREYCTRFALFFHIFLCRFSVIFCPKKAQREALLRQVNFSLLHTARFLLEKNFSLLEKFLFFVHIFALFFDTPAERAKTIGCARERATSTNEDFPAFGDDDAARAFPQATSLQVEGSLCLPKG